MQYLFAHNRLLPIIQCIAMMLALSIGSFSNGDTVAFSFIGTNVDNGQLAGGYYMFDATILPSVVEVYPDSKFYQFTYSPLGQAAIDPALTDKSPRYLSGGAAHSTQVEGQQGGAYIEYGADDYFVLYENTGSSTSATPLGSVISSYGGVAAVASPDTYIKTPEIAPITGQQVLSDAKTLSFLKPVASGHAVTASLVPYVNIGGTEFTMRADDLAHLMGYDHFNWYQIVNQDPQRMLTNPFIDPLPGSISPPVNGVPSHPADSLPFYWDEKTGGAYDVLSHSGATLDFYDEPSFSNRGSFPNTHDTFVTSLVGVYGPDHFGPGNFDVLKTFTWTSNYDGVASGGTATDNRNLAPLSGGTGGVTILQSDVPLNSLSQDVLAQMIADGAGNVSLPEPSTLALAALGSLALLTYRRRFT